MKKEAEINRKYFFRLFISFLCLSIIPLIISVSTIMHRNYNIFLSYYKANSEKLSETNKHLLETAINEYSQVVESLAANQQIADRILSNQNLRHNDYINNLLSDAMAGRENKFELSIITLDSENYFATGTLQTTNSIKMREWGVLYVSQQSPENTAVFPNVYETSKGKICLSLAKAVVKEKSIIGFVIADIYEEMLLSELGETPYSNTEIALKHSSGYHILNTTGKANVIPGKSALIRINDLDYYTTINNLDSYGFTIYSYLPAFEFRETTASMIENSVVILCLLVLVCFVAATIITRKLYSPVGILVGAMREFSDGNLHYRLESDGKDEIAIVSKVFNEMIEKINQQIDQISEQVSRQKVSELKALQAQINPHFLFNMLSEIRALAKLNRNEDVVKFILNLSRLLRINMSNKKSTVMLGNDLDFIENYLALQKLRYDDSFDVYFDILPETLKYSIPVLLIQPIVENAIQHGISQKKRGVIKISSSIKEGFLILTVYDNGLGMSAEKLAYIQNFEESSLRDSFAIENISTRLKLAFANNAKLLIDSEKGKFTEVTIKLPIDKLEAYEDV